ncbi:MAG: T9SS type A sorting domain-containing protein [Saprospiraceae bacterium]|nr:T9SS type A sorting domain-containing protein [Saprospiraceae bacterium]
MKFLKAKSFILPLFCALLFPFISSAQQVLVQEPEMTVNEPVTTDAPAGDLSPVQYSSPGIFAEPMKTPMADLHAPTHLRDCEAKKIRDPYMEALREEANDLRVLEEAALGVIPNPFEASDNFAITPTVVSSWNATHVGSGNPPDNTMAISNDGYVVTSVNSRIAVYNSSGTVLGQWNLYDFFYGASAGVVNDFFDPNVIYDAGQNRFVFTCSVGRTTANSRLLVAFSSGSNPTTGWWCYYLTGNPMNNSGWLDYPRIGVSTADVFVTGNIYNNAGSYLGSVIYQMTKAPGYTGASLNWQTWSGLSGSPFAITPVSTGNGTNFGPGLYFVAHTPGSGSATKLYRITDNMSASGETITYNSISSPAYTAASNAYQSGTSERLDIGDSRHISAFIVNGLIHYVFAGAVSGTSYSRLHYHRLNPTALTITSKQIYSTGYDLSYPSIAWSASTSTDKGVLIAFQYSNSSSFPGVGALNVDDALGVSSWVTCAAGTGYVDLTGAGAATSRWGDYTYLCRKRNSSPVRVWGAISFGNTSHNYTNKVFQLKVGAAFDDGNGDRSDDVVTTEKSDVEMYPNPTVTGSFNVFIDKKQAGSCGVQVFDITGRLVHEETLDQADAGKVHFDVRNTALKPGAYMVNITDNKQVIRNEKLVVLQ